MKNLIIISGIICFFSSGCGWFNLAYTNTALSQQAGNPTPPPPAPVGGLCTPLNLGDLGLNANVTGTISGMEVLTYRTSGNVIDDTAEYFVDLPRTLQASTSYVELTLKSFNRVAANDHFLLGFAYATTNLANWVGMRLESDAGLSVRTRVSITINTNGSEIISTLFPGLDVYTSLPYTVGLRLNRATGEVTYQDSLGNSGLLGQNVNLNSMASLTTGFGAAVQQVGDTLTTELNVGDQPYKLTPPAGSSDMCGNAL